MKKFLFLLPLLILAVPSNILSAQVTTTRIEWDLKATTVADVATYTQVVKLDATTITTVPVCTQAGADVTCVVPIPPLVAGTHTVSVKATKNNVSSEMVVAGLSGINGPKNPEGLRINIRVDVTIP